MRLHNRWLVEKEEVQEDELTEIQRPETGFYVA